MDYLNYLLNKFKQNLEFEGEVFENGARLICHMPHVAPLAWLHQIFPPLDEKYFDVIEQSMNVKIPNDYRAFLMQMNGTKLFSRQLCLDGKRFNYDRGNLIDLIQPFDLIVANYYERPEKLPEEVLVIGSYYQDSSKIAIVMSHSKIIRYNSENLEIYNEWDNFDSFFISEIERLSALFFPNGDLIEPNSNQLPQKSFSNYWIV